MRPQGHAGPQQIHEKETIRVGGAAVVVGVLLGFVFLWPGPQHFAVIMLCIAPIFLIGISEDLTNNVSALARLMISIVSATSLVIFESNCYFADWVCTIRPTFDDASFGSDPVDCFRHHNVSCDKHY